MTGSSNFHGMGVLENVGKLMPGSMALDGAGYPAETSKLQ